MDLTAANQPEPPAGATPPRSSHHLMWRLLRDYVRPHVGRLLWAAAFMAVVAAATGLNAWLLEPAIDKVFVRQVPGMLILVPEDRPAIVATVLDSPSVPTLKAS